MFSIHINKSIEDNDLKGLLEQDKKEINLPVLSDIRVMNTLTNFKITL